jgi:anti-sigma factor RsiW
MNRCERQKQVQDYLDHELPEDEAHSFRQHLRVCPRCAAELALYRRAFAALDRLPLAPAPRALTQRVFDQVLPSRVRRRWVARVGWSYAAAFAVCVGTLIVWMGQPGPRAILDSLSAAASSRLVESMTFVLNAVAFAVFSLASGWGRLAFVAEFLAPLARALGALLSQPEILASLGMAAVVSAAVLWWMRPREKGPSDEVHHVGVLGF